KNRAAETISDSESEGVGVRVLADSAWGFACTGSLDESAARDAALRACGFARAAPAREDRAFAPLEPQHGTHRTPLGRDPFDISLADKIALCLRAEEAMQHSDVTVTTASVRAHREEKMLVSSEGSEIAQELVECGGGIDAMATGNGLFQIRSYPSAHGGVSAQAGWEFVEELGLEREAPRVGEQAAA